MASSRSASPKHRPDKAHLSLAETMSAFCDPVRWYVVSRLANGEGFPVVDLAKELGQKADNISKQLATLRRYGVTVIGRGGLHYIAPKYRLPEGATELDLGYFLLRLQYVE